MANLPASQVRIGDFVRFNSPNGSLGTVSCVRTDGRFKEDPACYVTWHYGLDVKGEPITASSNLHDLRDLVLISKEEFEKTANNPCGW